MSLTLTADAAVLLALQTLGIYQPFQALSAADGQLGRQILAEMVDNWNTQQLTVTVQDRFVFDLVSGQGSPDNPYTIGPGGDFDTGTAARPVEIRSASILLNTTSPYPVEIPLAILTDDMYSVQQIKSIQTQIPQSLYYQASVPLGTIQLWNVPNTAENDLVLYIDRLTPQFTGAAIAYTCPPGYAKAFRLCLAEALVPFYGVPDDISGKVTADARQAFMDIKLQNAPMQDLSTDPGFLSDRHGTYIIQTDTGM